MFYFRPIKNKLDSLEAILFQKIILFLLFQDVFKEISGNNTPILKFFKYESKKKRKIKNYKNFWNLIYVPVYFLFEFFGLS